MARKLNPEGREHLTPELREHFEKTGYDGVFFDVAHHRYSTPEKHRAALYWLREQRADREDREGMRFRTLLTVGVLTLLATGLAIAVAVWLGRVF